MGWWTQLVFGKNCGSVENDRFIKKFGPHHGFLNRWVAFHFAIARIANNRKRRLVSILNEVTGFKLEGI